MTEKLFTSIGDILGSYNLKKPAVYDLLYRSICDSFTSYTYYILAYAGTPEKVGGETAKFYITTTDKYTR